MLSADSSTSTPWLNPKIHTNFTLSIYGMSAQTGCSQQYRLGLQEGCNVGEHMQTSMYAYLPHDLSKAHGLVNAWDGAC